MREFALALATASGSAVVTYFMTAPDPIQWPLVAGLLSIAVFFAVLYFVRRHDAPLPPTKRERWERQQEEDRLRSFWHSPAGKHVRDLSFLADDSAQVDPETGQAEVDIAVPVTWKNRWAWRLTRFVQRRYRVPRLGWRLLPVPVYFWAMRRLGYVECTGPVQTLSIRCARCLASLIWDMRAAGYAPDACPICGESWADQASLLRAVMGVAKTVDKSGDGG
jgi:hypothetical protein